MVAVLAISMLLLAGETIAREEGITGDEAEGGTDVAKSGCTCHTNNEIAPTDSVTLILDKVPFGYEPGSSYEMMIQLIGGPDIDTHHATGGFSLRVSAGSLAAAPGFETLVQNGDDETTLTHTKAGSNTEDRIWSLVWTAPDAGTEEVDFWLAGNAVDGNAAPMAPDAYNRLSFSLKEGFDKEGSTRAIFVGDGNVQAPESGTGEIDLHSMGAPFRAHWLGLLGFGAVISVIIFCGFFLRYGFSRHYVGRSNLLRLRIKTLKRGDQF